VQIIIQLQAGIDDNHLTLALEVESAAIYFRQRYHSEMKNDLQFLTIDMGGE